MRVNRESLVRIARETAQERSFNNRNIIAAYLTGSLAAEGEPMLGGTTDIDLVFVHNIPPAKEREIVKLTPDFHLDIRHRNKSEFRSPRELRTDPYLGTEMYDPMLISQTEKLFEFVQAGLRAGFEFNAPSLVLARSRKLLAEARKHWMGLAEAAIVGAGAPEVKRYLDALAAAANAVAELTGGPLAERRLLVEFPARAEAAERPDFTEGLFQLVGADRIEPGVLSGWLRAWGADFLAAAQDTRVDLDIHPARYNYYEKAIQALLAGETPMTALWPLIHSWTLACQVIDPQQTGEWRAAAKQLGLLGDDLEQRASALDQYLDKIEIRLDEIATASGVETSGRL